MILDCALIAGLVIWAVVRNRSARPGSRPESSATCTTESVRGLVGWSRTDERDGSQFERDRPTSVFIRFQTRGFHNRSIRVFQTTEAATAPATMPKLTVSGHHG